jgi:hypothetical protein
LAIPDVDLNGVSRREVSGEDLLRQRVVQLRADGALERARTVDRIEASLAEQVEGVIRELAVGDLGGVTEICTTSKPCELLATILSADVHSCRCFRPGLLEPRPVLWAGIVTRDGRALAQQ